MEQSTKNWAPAFFKNKIQMISCLELTVSLCQQSLVSGMRPELYTNRNLLVCIYFVVRDHTAEAIYSSDSALNATRRKGTPGLRPQSTAAGPAPPCKQRPTLSPHNTSCIYSLWILNYATQHNLLWYHFNGKDFFFFKMLYKLARYTQL